MQKEKRGLRQNAILVAGCAAVITAGLVTAIGAANVGAGVASADEGFSTGLMDPVQWQTDPSDNPEDYLGLIYGGYDERAAEYAPVVITYEDGTMVQRTPGGPARDSTANVKDYISWNTYRLDADNRGCLSCHDDLGETVLGINGAAHPDIDNLGIQIEVKQCIDCHTTHLGGAYQSQFSGLIHGIHSGNDVFDAMGGDCWSCHYGMAGETSSVEPGMYLWDYVKHGVLRGITKVNADTFVANYSPEFTWTQDVVQPDGQIFSYNYIKGRTNDVSTTRFGRWYLGMEPDPATDGVYDEWYVTFGGEIDNPVTLSISEMLEALPLETRMLQFQCANNRGGGTYVTQAEVTGFPVSAIMEYVGVKDTALRLTAVSADGKSGSAPMDWVDVNDAYLVIDVNGKPLGYAEGYPMQLWVPGMVADPFVKAVTDLNFEAEEYVEPSFMTRFRTVEADGVAKNSNAGICYLKEGQILQVGEAYTFQGYASAVERSISAVEFSFDQGKTWVRYETPDNDMSKWTWWNLSWTPTQTGCYTIAVRAVDETGCVTKDVHEIMVNVQDLAAAE